MNHTDKIIKLVTAALMAALTCVVTMFLPIKIPNTQGGYIHPGDAFVLLSGIILGPLYGGLAAGVGSLMADIFVGALVYAPATLIIKTLAAIAGVVSYRYIRKGSVILAGIFVGITVTVGYYIFDVILTGTLTAGFANIPFNLIQNVMGIILASLLLPLIKKIPQIRVMMGKQSKPY
jgi:uncharacterized membrane protein